MYDTKCEELARHFLDDEPELRDLAPVLAQEIQDSIEIWIEELKRDD